MTWFKTDDRFAKHKKVRALRTMGARVYADSLAVWLVCGVECAAQLGDTGVTPGFVSDVDLEGLAPIKPQAAKAAAEALVEAGLWERVEGGYLFHDWDEYQPTPDSVQSKRDKWNKDKARARGKKRGTAHASVAVSEVDTEVESTAKSPPCPSYPVPGPVPPSVESVSAGVDPAEFATTIRRRWAATYEQARGQMPIAADTESVRALDLAITANAAKRGEDPAVTLDAILAAYWSDPWPKVHRNRASTANLVSQFDRLLGTITAATPIKRAEPFDPSRHTPATADEEREQQAWIAAGCPPIRRAS